MLAYDKGWRVRTDFKQYQVGKELFLGCGGISILLKDRHMCMTNSRQAGLTENSHMGQSFKERFL